MDWFERLTGFREREYSATQSLLAVADGCLRSRVNGQVFAIGELETPTLAELRKRARAVSGGMQGPLGAACISGAESRTCIAIGRTSRRSVRRSTQNRSRH